MAMSKVAKAKQDQGWRKSGPMCGSCVSFSSKIQMITNRYGTYKEEKEKRCILGNFSTGKTCWCSKHHLRTE